MAIIVSPASTMIDRIPACCAATRRGAAAAPVHRTYLKIA
jgi:hypothetical protein